jgi:DNA-binding LacI/PurR family transcriptional regulator
MSLFSDDKRCRYADLNKIINDMYEETEGKCDGLIVIGKCNVDALKKLNQKYKNVVSVNRNSTNYEVDEVVCDGRKVATLALEYLVELGHRKIGYVGTCHNEARYRGFLDVVQKYNIDLEPRYILETKQSELEGYEMMKRILEFEDRPTGIYCANDITAIGMLKCLSRYKNQFYMPSIVASDDIDAAQNTRPMLTTVRLPKEEMGKFALKLLLDRIMGGHKGVIRIEVTGKLIVRNSCSSADKSSWSDYCI